MQLLKNKKVAAWGLAGLLLLTSLPTTVWADVNQDVQQADQMKSQLNALKTQQDATLDQIQQLESQINDTMTKSS
ncbi:MAG: hypothetical protein ACXVPK_07235, partial [Tumebacillaceae bacterium]